jgi:hypothetical protein
LGKLPYFISTLDLVLNKLYSSSTNIILCGDININYLDKVNDRIQRDSLLATYSLYNIVNFPTRVGSKSFMAIDDIFIHKYKLNSYSIISVLNGLSDHDAQFLLLNNTNIKDSNPRCCAIRQINKVNMDNFKLNLSYELWEEIFLEDEVDKLFNNFLNKHLRIFNSRFAVKKFFNNYNDKAWLTTGIRISCQHKRNLYMLCRNVKNPILYTSYKKYCRILREDIKAAKRNYYNKLIAKTNNKPKTLWGIVNKITGKCKNTCHPMEIVLDGVKYEDSQNIANAINSNFDTIVYKQLKATDTASEFIFNKESFKSSMSIGPMNDIIYAPVTGKELKDIFKSLKNKKSSGYDGISMRLMKLSMPYIISPLLYIYNRALSLGILPGIHKYIQIYMKGDEVEISKYRPISVLTSFSKIFEKVIFKILYICILSHIATSLSLFFPSFIFKRLYAHVSLNNILSVEQHGFRRKGSTETTIFDLTNNVLQSLTDSKQVGGIFCDLTKEFDNVNHIILSTNLGFYGVRGTFFKLITSYLNNRYQRVVIKDKQSTQYFSEGWIGCSARLDSWTFVSFVVYK